MDDNTQTLLAGMFTAAFYANQPPLTSRITAANVPPDAANGTLEKMHAREHFRAMYQTFQTYKILIAHEVNEASKGT